MDVCRLRTTNPDVAADIGEGGPSASVYSCSVIQSRPYSHPITTLGLLVVAVHYCVQIFLTPWTAARQASLSITNSWSLLKLMSIESVMHPTISPSVVPFSSCLQSFAASGSFPMSQLFPSGGRRIGASASASVLPISIQD